MRIYIKGAHKKNPVRRVAAMLAGVLLISLCLGFSVSAAGGDVFVALGADLKEEERADVLEQLGITVAELAECTVVTVTNEEEHAYLGGYLDENVIGTRALSCVLVEALEPGSGLDVTTKNISYCTIGMYRNALITAGVEDARITVAGPFTISGTAALIGITKAYEGLTGAEVSEESLETASNELVLTGELAQRVGDPAKAEQLIAALKQEVAEHGLGDEEALSGLFDKVQEEVGVTLEEADIEKLTGLLEKVDALDLDTDALKSQAKDIYESIKDMDISVSQETKDNIGNFFTGILEKVLELIGGFLG